MNELADPTMGWSFSEVLNTDAGSAVHDIYGKLYAHVGSVLSKFKQHLSDTGARFEPGFSTNKNCCKRFAVY